MLSEFRIRIIFPYFIVCLFVLNVTSIAWAGTLRWSGGGADALASNPLNWAGGVSPHNGNAVVFDSSSSKDCRWDLSITVSSFHIHPGYEGSITIDADLIIDNPFTWTGEGGDTLASNPDNWAGGGVPGDGDNIDFEGTHDCLWDLDIIPASFTMEPDFTGIVTLMTDLTLEGALAVNGGLLDLNNNDLRVDGDLSTGLYAALYASASEIRLKGDWINRGAFFSGTSRVTLNGTNQTVYGDNTFYTLVKTTDLAATLYFEAGRTQTVLNDLVLQGSGNNLLLLRSTVDESFWFIDPGSTRSISHADIKDMKNVHQVGIDVDHSLNAGHNSNVFFGADQCL